MPDVPKISPKQTRGLYKESRKPGANTGSNAIRLGGPYAWDRYPFDGMRIHHLALRTADIERLKRFYAELLHFTVIRETDRSVWLRSGDAVVMLERIAPGEPPVPQGSMELVAFAASESERLALRDQLAIAGIAIEDATEHTVYFRDPDGRRVGISSYPLPPMGLGGRLPRPGRD